MRRRSKIPPFIRSVVMHSWLKLTWSEPVFTTAIAVIFALIFLIASASGGIIVGVVNVDLKVTARETVVVELPYNIGYMSFHQDESFPQAQNIGASYMEVAPIWESGNQVEIHTIQEGYLYDSVVWAGLATPIGQREIVANSGLLFGDGRPLPEGYDGDGDPDNTEPLLYIPWQFALQPQNNTFQYGYGWVSIWHINTQMSPVDETGIRYDLSPSYIVHQVVFASEEISLSAGVIPPEWYGGGGSTGGENSSSAVPEPSSVIIALFLVTGLVFRAVKIRRCCT